MKALLDACVLYPTVMRGMLLGAAGAGFFEPFWSERLLEEWARAARKLGATGEMQARAEIALARADWPEAIVPPATGIEARIVLPDPADEHVLASAVASSADMLITLNARDFPKATLREEGLDRMDPDLFLLRFLCEDPARMIAVAERVRGEAGRLSGEIPPMRWLMKKARLPRLGKALAAWPELPGA